MSVGSETDSVFLLRIERKSPVFSSCENSHVDRKNPLFVCVFWETFELKSRSFLGAWRFFFRDFGRFSRPRSRD